MTREEKEKPLDKTVRNHQTDTHTAAAALKHRLTLRSILSEPNSADGECVKQCHLGDAMRSELSTGTASSPHTSSAWCDLLYADLKLQNSYPTHKVNSNCDVRAVCSAERCVSGASAMRMANGMMGNVCRARDCNGGLWLAGENSGQIALHECHSQELVEALVVRVHCAADEDQLPLHRHLMLMPVRIVNLCRN